jgi:hypothetical protein
MTMKKTYMKPSITVESTETSTMICSSQRITSDNGINYGGVDVEGDKDPASRRQQDIWDD